MTQALGGSGPQPGGKGGSLEVVEGQPGSPTDGTAVDGSGGGGGGVGRIYLRSTSGQASLRGATISPAAGLGDLRLE